MQDLIEEYKRQIEVLEKIEQADKLRLKSARRTIEKQKIKRKIETTQDQIFDLAFALKEMEENT